MIKNILIDLDDTLYDFRKAEKIALRNTLEAIGIEPKEEIVKRYHEVNEEQWKKLERKEITREELKVKRFEFLSKDFVMETSAKEIAKIYEEFLSRGHFFIPGAEELLIELSKKYYLYLVTNGITHVQKGRIKSGKISRYFTHIFISEQVGYDKPSKEYFEACFEKIHPFRREETILIGDSLTSDMLGGKNAGIKTVWFNPENIDNKTFIQPDFMVFDLLEIPRLLEEIENS